MVGRRTDDPASDRGSSRRTVLRGVAWATPVVLGVAPAPAFAASSCLGAGVCPDPSFGSPNTASASPGVTNGVGTYTRSGSWTYTANGSGWSGGNAVGFGTGSKGTQFAATAEPTSGNRILTLTQTGQPALQASCKYVLTFGIIYYTGSANISVSAYAGNAAVASYSTAGKTGQNTDAGLQSFVLPAGSTGVLSFRFFFPATAQDSNDLTMYAPSLTCS